VLQTQNREEWVEEWSYFIVSEGVVLFYSGWSGLIVGDGVVLFQSG
jgi:hypothetical protein